jgi:Putative zincin peptidase
MDDAPVRRELTMTAGEANLRALVFVIPIILLLGLPFYFLWLRDFTLENLIGFYQNNRHMISFGILWMLIILFTGIILHELIHGLTFLLFCKNGFKSIKFGIMWKYLAPYCHCKEPLPIRPYIIGALMPAIVLGFIPAGYGLLTGKFIPLVFGMIFSIASGGDFLIVWLLRGQPKDSFVLDHESKVGCYILEKQ